MKYLVPRELTLAQLSTIVRNRLSLNQAESFFLFSSGGVMVTMSSTVQELYAANMDNDGFLYIEYASQETFGASMHSTEGVQAGVTMSSVGGVLAATDLMMSPLLGRAG